MKYQNISDQGIRLERHGETIEVEPGGEVLLAPVLAKALLEQGILAPVNPPAPTVRKTAQKEVKSDG